MIDRMTKIKANATNNLRLLLTDHLLFRAPIEFKNGDKIWFYGHEHDCTYKQVRWGYVPEILLDAERGFNNLVNYIEGLIAKKAIKTAKIYSRVTSHAPFLKLHRSWYAGKWENIIEPAFEGSTVVRKLDFKIIDGLIEIDDGFNEGLPDFQDEINKAFNRPTDAKV